MANKHIEGKSYLQINKNKNTTKNKKGFSRGHISKKLYLSQSRDFAVLVGT